MYIFYTILACCVASTMCVTMVTESQTLYHERLQHGQSKIYLLSNLIPGELYEFKVSYPAIQPYTFTIQFTDSLNKMPQRKLLDIEKEEFIPQYEKIYVIVQAHDYEKAVKHAPYVQYSVYFERVHYGVPAQAVRLILYCICLLPPTLYATYWILTHWFEKPQHVSDKDS